VVVDIHEVVPVEYQSGDSVRSASSGVDVIDNHEALPDPYVGIISILMRYRVSFSTPAVMTSSLVAVCADLGRPAFLRACVTKTLLQASNILASEDGDQESVTYSYVAVPDRQLQARRITHVAVLMSIRSQPSSALQLVSVEYRRDSKCC
jgi:hypothetical protein